MSIERYVKAQESVWQQVVEELSAGKKLTHWSWFIFPQIQGLGESAMSKRYALESTDEAAALWGHPILGPRLRQCIELMLKHEGRFTPQEILGHIDAVKLRSCLTLFERAIPAENLFSEALDHLYHGERDEHTLIIIGHKSLLSRDQKVNHLLAKISLHKLAKGNQLPRTFVEPRGSMIPFNSKKKSS